MPQTVFRQPPAPGRPSGGAASCAGGAVAGRLCAGRDHRLFARLVLAGLVAAAPAGGQFVPFEVPSVVAVRAVWSHTAARPGDRLELAVVIDVEPGWHLNADADQIVPPDVFMQIPTRLTVQRIDPALRLGAVRFPTAAALSFGFADVSLKVFHDRVVLHAPVEVAADAAVGVAEVVLELDYQACNDTACLPPAQVTVSAPLQLVEPGRAVAAGEPELFETAPVPGAAGQPPAAEDVDFAFFGARFTIDTATAAGFVIFLLLAAGGGLLLNFTPCVLPVIPIKIIGLSQAAGSRGRCLALGLTMSAGVVAFWLGLGGLIALLSGFTAANQLFQYAWFTIGVGVVIAVMAVGMCGVFAVRLPRFVYLLNPGHDTLRGSFGFGVMTAVLSTPCTAPFMGSAAAAAATQTTMVILLTFVAIGAGMALPYAVLSAWPALVARMPRTGPASELIKQVMGLLMLAASAYFIGVGVAALLKPTDGPTSTAYWWPVAALIVTAGLWLGVRTFRITRAPDKRVVFASLALALVLLGPAAAVRLTAAGPIAWAQFTMQRLDAQLRAGRVAVLDFTAEWCLNCKALEQTVLRDRRVAAALQADDVVAMKVDITSRSNRDGYEMLARVGRVTIPLLVVFAPDGTEMFKSDAYSVAEVLDAVARARARPRAASAPGATRPSAPVVQGRGPIAGDGDGR